MEGSGAGPSLKRADKDSLESAASTKRQRVGYVVEWSDEDEELAIEDDIPLDYDLPDEISALPKQVYRRVLRHIPEIPYVPITNDDGSRVYLRVFAEKSDDDEESAIFNKSKLHKLGSLLGVDFHELKREAKTLKDKFHAALAEAVEKENVAPSKKDDILWVEKYKPRSYLDLLSEETVNRNVLHWLKLWDKTVFGSDYLSKVKVTKEKYAKLEAKEKEKERFKPRQVTVEDDEYDETGRPKQKVALLHGPPGLGKTTCAHIVAKHAGYKVRELNASDDRSVDIFKKVLDATTQSRTEVFQDGRPNCLIIDEIDGAPLATVNILVDLITGKATESGKKKLKKTLRRPVICICNDLYAPSLKTLRQLALVVQFIPVPVTSLVERVQEISLKEKLELNNASIHSLCEKSECDIRSCLSTLQFMKRKNCSTKDALFSQVGYKDKSKGIFAVWNDVFTLPEGKKHFDATDPSKSDVRFNNLLRVAQSFGDYEKLQSGVFENYLKIKFKDSYFQSITEGLSWTNWFEEIRHHVERTQNYSMYGYLPIYFVVVHFLFATRNWFKMQYPNTEIMSRAPRFQHIVKTQMSEISPMVGRYLNTNGMVLDILPCLINIIQPSTIRPVPSQIWSARERETLKNVVEIMIAYNLSYCQKKTEEGSYNFILEPDIEELCRFSTKEVTTKRQFAYAIKQLVSREIETERLRRNDFTDNNTTNTAEPNFVKPETPKPTTSKPVKPIPATSVPKDFFGRPIILSDEAVKAEEEKKSRGPKVYFRFKEGYSNAVRRYVKMKDLL